MKTISLKKVSAVAVASLGFGLLSVVPASAADVTFTQATAAATTTTVGTATAVPVTFGTVSADVDTACAITFTPTSQTGAGIQAATFGNSTLTVGSGSNLGWATTATGTGALTMTAATTFTNATKVLTDGKIVGSFNFTPTLAGVYTVTITATRVGSGCSAAPAAGTFTLTVGTNSSIAALTGDGGTPTLNNAVRGVAGPANSISAELIIPTTVSSTIRRLVRVSGDLSIDAASTTNATGGTNSNTTTIATDKKSVQVVAVQDSTAKTVHGRTALTIMTPTVGTFTISVFNSTNAGIYDATAAETITVTVNAAAVRGTLSVADSTSLWDKDALSSGYSTPSPAADEASVVSAAINTQAGGTKVVLKDATTAAMPDTTVVSATITGPGVIAGHGTLASATTYGRSIVGTSTSGDFYVLAKADGTPGVATITIRVGTVVVATETVSFYGAVSKYTATTQLVAKADGSTVGDAVVVCATDAANIALPSETIYAFSGDTAVATVATSASTGAAAVTTVTATPGASNYVAIKGIGCAGFSVTALSQILKSSVVVSFGNATTLAASTVRTTATVNVGSVAATTVTLALNKATYAPGEKMTATLTFRDAQGRLVGAGPGTGVLTATGLVPSASIVGAPFFGTGANIATALGTATSELFAPLQSGPVTISGKTGAGSTGTYLVTAAQDITLTATATVTQSSDISAIATSISALNAKIVALNALIAKIMKRLNIR